MKTVEDPDIVALFKNSLERELIETGRLIDESREYRARVELDQQSVGRLSRMDAMQSQAMAQDLNRRRQNRKIAIACGEQIAVRRLDIDPTFEACVRCAP